MTDYKLYPNLPPWGPEILGPSVPPPLAGSSGSVFPQVGFHLSVINAKRQGLIDKEKMFKKKYKKYN